MLVIRAHSVLFTASSLPVLRDSSQVANTGCSRSDGFG